MSGLSRKSKISILIFGITLTCLPAVFLAAQNPGFPSPKPRPSPNAPDPAYPPGLDGPGIKNPDERALDRQNQIDLKNDIDRLYALAFELREHMKTTDGTSTLSLEVVKKAQVIEKLAKTIKDRAKH